MTVHARQFTTSGRSQPWWYAALNWLTAPLPAGSFDASVWIQDAVDKVGEEPAPEVRVAFDALLQSIAADAAFGTIGRTAAKTDCEAKLLEHLKARAEVRAGHVQAPEDMPDPIYILGWMRSGTTALHRLLAADPDNWWPHHYETLHPTPPAGEDDRPQQTQAMLDELGRVSPYYQAIHPMQPMNPEECVNLFTHVFRTPQYAVQYQVPSYLAWLDAQDPDVAYRQYVEELGILRYHRGGGERMVLKDPTHMGFLPSILKVFPRARFVFIHRDPVEVFSSMSSMYAYTRAIFSRDVDPTKIGPELFDDPLLKAHADGLEVCDSLKPGRVVHVRHDDLRKDPIGEARRIYETFGIGWTEAAAHAMTEHTHEPRVRHPHEHSPEAFGLDPAAMRERLKPYLQRFEI